MKTRAKQPRVQRIVHLIASHHHSACPMSGRPIPSLRLDEEKITKRTHLSLVAIRPWLQWILAFLADCAKEKRTHFTRALDAPNQRIHVKKTCF